MEVRVDRSATRRSERDIATVLEAPIFGESFTDHMVTMEFRTGQWGPLQLGPFADLSLSPASLALHYGQSIFEALKAYSQPDESIALFRPSSNAARMASSARRLAMPLLPEGAFEVACALLSAADSNWVPRQEGSALYVRPFMFASEPHLSVRPANEYLFVVIASPVASYFGGHLGAITVAVETEDVRATPGGTGAAKFAGNYAAGFAAHGRAGSAGCDQVLWLDSAEHRWVEELNAMNVMFLWERDGGRVLTTPPLTGTILDGVTRDTLLQLGMERLDAVGIDSVVQERTSVGDITEGVVNGSLLEMFACGTAAAIAPIGNLVLSGEPMLIGDGKPGPVTVALRESLTALQYGRAPDHKGWLVSPEDLLARYRVDVEF